MLALHRRRLCDHSQTSRFQAAQLRDQLISEAIAEIIFLRPLAQILKGQYGQHDPSGWPRLRPDSPVGGHQQNREAQEHASKRQAGLPRLQFGNQGVVASSLGVRWRLVRSVEPLYLSDEAIAPARQGLNELRSLGRVPKSVS